MVLIVLICSLFELSAHVSHVIILHGGDSISLLSTYIISIDLFLGSTSSCPRLESHAIYCCRKSASLPAVPFMLQSLSVHFSLSISPSFPFLLPFPRSPSYVSHRCLYFPLFPPLPLSRFLFLTVLFSFQL